MARSTRRVGVSISRFATAYPHKAIGKKPGAVEGASPCLKFQMTGDRLAVAAGAGPSDCIGSVGALRLNISRHVRAGGAA